MSVRFPHAPTRRSLGVGLDLPWTGDVGFRRDADGGEGPTQRTARFLTGEAARLGHVFVSLQARDRSRPRWEDYRSAWDALFAGVPHAVRGLHHTALSLGSLVPMDRTRTLAMTASIIEHHGIAWVNEDLGFWSLDGKPLPYPLPPVLDARAIAPAVRAVRECQAALPVPLVVEFPGFSDDASLVLGAMHAYDYFRAVAEDADAPVTLDVGHLLSYQWMRGRRGDALYEELERLPLANAFELHLAGSSIVDGHFVDAHHGALLDAQLELVVRLAPICPNLRAITFEDPVLDAEGGLDGKSASSLSRLEAALAPWLAGETRPMPIPPCATGRVPEIDLVPVEHRLAAEIAGRTPAPLPDALADLAIPAFGSFEAVRALWRSRLLGRAHRGLGTLEARFPITFAAWRAARDAASDDVLTDELLASDEALAWREGLTVTEGACIEEVFAAFAERNGLADPATREEEVASAVLRAIALAPDPAFRIPPFVRRRAAAHFAVTRAGTLHAAFAGRYVRGPITPLLVDLLGGAAAESIAAARGLPVELVQRAAGELARMGLG